MQRIIREYFESLYSSKLENLNEMDEYLDAYNQPKLKQEDIKHVNSAITSNEIEIVSLQTRAQDLMDSQPNFPNPLERN
jgi:hypothetical protein